MEFVRKEAKYLCNIAWDLMNIGISIPPFLLSNYRDCPGYTIRILPELDQVRSNKCRYAISSNPQNPFSGHYCFNEQMWDAEHRTVTPGTIIEQLAEQVRSNTII